MNTTIRTAASSDEMGLSELEGSCFDEDRRASRRSLRRSLTSARQVVRVIDLPPANESLVPSLLGAATIWFYPRSLRIYSVAVRPESRGEGLGRRLVADAFRLARERGLARITLEADQSNPTLIRWYESQGFKVTGQLPSYYAAGRHAVRMVCPVA
jgi:ribosomal protein S18 acetylase RimI-like enzyme